MDMVVGAEERRETLRADDIDFVNSVPQIELTSRSQKLTAAFVEFDLPVVTDADELPLLNRLEFSSAGRYERYAFDAQQSQPLAADLHRFTPSAGVLWKPAPAFAVRANWSKVYKIPGLNDLFRPTLDLILPYFPDPLSPTGLATNVRYIYGGNPSLREQSGESTTVGAEFAPLAVPSLRLRAVYSEIVFKNLITDPFTIFNLSQVLANPNEFPGTSVRSASGALLQVSEVPVNLAERSRRALDLSARYSLSLAKGELSLQLDTTRTLSLDVTVTPGSAPQPIAGTIDGPSAWQLRATSGYQLGPAFATLVWNYGSGYLNTDPTAVTTRVASYAPADLIGGYRFDANRVSLTVGVYNVFNAGFPFVDNAFGYDARRVDVRGRRAQIALKVDF
jgi:iron complex outermembrane recepter protein